MGTLFVVATPIGNLEDITLRALHVLHGVGLIAAEDTRVTRRLLARHSIATPTISFHEHSSPGRLASIIERLADMDVALVTDAGTPGISDPGTSLVAEALAAGIRVVPVPGPSAVAAALSVSGLAGDAHLFVGFLPRRTAARRALLAALVSERRTLVAYEAPHRLRAALLDIEAALGPDRRLLVARELTKLHEEVWSGRLGDAIAEWSDRQPRGEFVLVISGADKGSDTGTDAAAAAWSDERVRAEMAALAASGLGVREASRQVAARSSRTARDVYQLAHKGRAQRDPD